MRILEICVELDGGGVDRYLYNYCSRIEDVQFDFAVIDQPRRGILEDGVEALGSRIFRVPRQSAGPWKNFRALRAIMRANHYDAVHVHLGHKSAVALLCAKLCGVKTRIVHAHIAFIPETKRQRLIRRLLTVPVKLLASSLAACGNDAGAWLWGQRDFEAGKVCVQNNAILAREFSFKPETRAEVRRELGFGDDELLFGHVGRLCDQKNQLRLVEIFAAIYDRESSARLVLVGSGEQEQQLRDRVRELGIGQKVCFLGVRSDVPRLLNAMDAFVFPSKYEGLPFTLIETQCNGLRALCSDSVTAQVRITDCVDFLSLSAGDGEWAERALELARRGHDANAWQGVRDAGYDIETEAKKLRAYYAEQIDRNK